jgi:hypothetical protein
VADGIRTIMPLDLWEKSSEDVRERWRDIARTLRDEGDAEAIPRALQTCFWFGAQASRSGPGPRAEMSLLNLLPPDLATRLTRPPAKP